MFAMDCDGVCGGANRPPCLAKMMLKMEDEVFYISDETEGYKETKIVGTNTGMLSYYLSSFLLSPINLFSFDYSFSLYVDDILLTNWTEVDISPNDTFVVIFSSNISVFKQQIVFKVIDLFLFTVNYQIGNGQRYTSSIEVLMKSECDNVNSFYTCNNFPGCFWCIQINGYNGYSNILESKGVCIEGSTISDCKFSSSIHFIISFATIFIILSI